MGETGGFHGGDTDANGVLWGLPNRKIAPPRMSEE